MKRAALVLVALALSACTPTRTVIYEDGSYITSDGTAGCVRGALCDDTKDTANETYGP